MKLRIETENMKMEITLTDEMQELLRDMKGLEAIATQKWESMVQWQKEFNILNKNVEYVKMKKRVNAYIDEAINIVKHTDLLFWELV